jgi:hypothetical protein
VITLPHFDYSADEVGIDQVALVFEPGRVLQPRVVVGTGLKDIEEVGFVGPGARHAHL